MENTDDKKEIQNLKTTIDYVFQNINKGQKIDINLVNEMHSILLESVRGYEKGPGQIRNTQNWIGPRRAGIECATFVPPKPEDVLSLLMNLYEYMNEEFVDPILLNIAISHAQFETIHAYRDGNGRLDRALITIQMAMFEESSPLLFMSEVLELYKPSYKKILWILEKGMLQDI